MKNTLMYAQFCLRYSFFFLQNCMSMSKVKLNNKIFMKKYMFMKSAATGQSKEKIQFRKAEAFMYHLGLGTSAGLYSLHRMGLEPIVDSFQRSPTPSCFQAQKCRTKHQSLGIIVHSMPEIFYQ